MRLHHNAGSLERIVPSGNKKFAPLPPRRIFSTMPAGQQLLFAPEKPLVKRLGKRFFKQLPRQAGVYKMRNAAGEIVYVGKAKDLKQRLASYRVAHPERMDRRHLRLLHQVTHIEFELCPTEASALKQEAKLIRELKPKFNRAGVWPGKPQFLVWRFTEPAIAFSVQEVPGLGWERFGSLGGYANRLKCILVRLLWLALNPDKTFVQMPLGWVQNRMSEVVEIQGCADELKPVLQEAFWGNSGLCLNWLAVKLAADRPAFEQAAMQKDLEELREFLEQDRPERKTRQLSLL